MVTEGNAFGAIPEIKPNLPLVVPEKSRGLHHRHSLLYEAYSECNRLEDDRIKADFNERYRQMNGMTLREMDHILDPVCSLCRDHERIGFVNGIKLGFILNHELNT